MELATHKPSIQCLPKALSMEIKQQGYEADQLLPRNVKVKNKRNYNSKPLHVFSTCTVTALPPVMIPPIFQPHLHHTNNFARRVSRHQPAKSGNIGRKASFILFRFFPADSLLLVNNQQ